MAKTFNTIFKNSSFSTAAFAVSTVVWLALTPFIVHSLGDVDYGVWILVGSICGFYGFLDFGIYSSIVRYASKYAALDDPDKINGVLSTCLVMFLVIGLLIILLSVIVAFMLPLFVNIPAGKEDMIRTVLIISGVTLALSFPFRVFSALLGALMKHNIGAAIAIITELFSAGLIVYALKNQGGLIALSLITLAVAILGYSINLYYAYRVYPALRIRLSLFDMERAKEVFHYSIYTFFVSMGDLLRFNLDSIVIGSMLSLSAITPYALAQKILKFPMLLVVRTFNVTRPLYSSYEAKNDFPAIHKLLINSTLYSALLSFFGASMLIIYGDTFMTLWVGEQYSQAGYPVLVILALSFSIAMAQSPSIHAAYGIEKHRFLGLITIFEGVFNLILSVILVKKMGIVGIALGTAIPMVLFKGVVQPVYICKIVDLPILRYLRQCFFMPFFAVLIFTAPHILLKDYLEISKFYQFAIAVTLSSCVFILFITAIIMFDSEQKAYWKGLLTSLKQKVAS
jgi:O-antigen/teichoic acid export membrane protein